MLTVALFELIPVNIMMIFDHAGVFLLNSKILPDSDFRPSYFSDGPAFGTPYF